MPYDDFLGQYAPRPAGTTVSAAPVMAPAQDSFPGGDPEFTAVWPQGLHTPAPQTGAMDPAMAPAQNGGAPPSGDFSLFASGPTGPEEDGAQQLAGTEQSAAPQASDTAPGFTYPVVYSTYQEMLRGIIGRYVIAEFLIGTTMLEQRVGTLTEVGPGYLVLKDPCTNAHVACDMYSLKFISILPPTSATEEALCTFQLFNKF